MQPPTNDHPQAAEISNDDILDAMRHIPGYLDITLEDFRILYRLARAHALERLFNQVRAGDLMRRDIRPINAQTRLDQAAQIMAEQKLKALPVVDTNQCVLGILTETDFLQRLQVGSFLELMPRLIANPADLGRCCHETTVGDAMTAPALCIPEDAGFTAIAAAFRRCPGRSLPVLGADGKLSGLLLRKQFVTACHWEAGP
jgi:CBS domain-containing membrane protein